MCAIIATDTSYFELTQMQEKEQVQFSVVAAEALASNGELCFSAEAYRNIIGSDGHWSYKENNIIQIPGGKKPQTCGRTPPW